MHLGILQTGHAPDALRPAHGDYADLFARLLAPYDFRFTTWNVVDMAFPDAPSAADGWLLTGSRHGAYEDHPWIPPLEDFIRDAHADAVPMVGVCFGHQIMAQALGGRVEKFPGGWTVGRHTYDIGGEHLPLNAWHQDQVTAPPPAATTIGFSASCRYAALKYGDRALSVQPHPEFDHAFVEGLIETRGDTVPADRLKAARASLGAPLASDRLAARIADVFHRAHA